MSNATGTYKVLDSLPFVLRYIDEELTYIDSGTPLKTLNSLLSQDLRSVLEVDNVMELVCSKDSTSYHRSLLKDWIRITRSEQARHLIYLFIPKISDLYKAPGHNWDVVRDEIRDVFGVEYDYQLINIAKKVQNKGKKTIAQDVAITLEAALDSIKPINLIHYMGEILYGSKLDASVAVVALLELYGHIWDPTDPRIDKLARCINDLATFMPELVNKVFGKPLHKKEACTLDSEFASSFTEVVALIVTMCGIGVTTVAKNSFLEGLKTAGFMASAITNLSKLGTLLQDGILRLVEHLGFKVERAEGKLGPLHDRIIGLKTRTDDLLNELNKSPRDYTGDPGKYRAHVHLCRTALNEYYKATRDAKDNSTTYQLVASIERSLALMTGQMEFYDGSTAGRVHPTVIWLFGETRIGKSQLADHIARKICEREGVDPSIYTTESMSKYWERYTQQMVTVFDDLGASKTSEDISMFASLVTCLPVTVPKAAVESKGMYFTSRYIVVASNFAEFSKEQSGLNLPEIICGRRDLLIHVSDSNFDRDSDNDHRKPDFSHLSLKLCKNFPEPELTTTDSKGKTRVSEVPRSNLLDLHEAIRELNTGEIVDSVYRMSNERLDSFVDKMPKVVTPFTNLKPNSGPIADIEDAERIQVPNDPFRVLHMLNVALGVTAKCSEELLINSLRNDEGLDEDGTAALTAFQNGSATIAQEGLLARVICARSNNDLYFYHDKKVLTTLKVEEPITTICVGIEDNKCYVYGPSVNNKEAGGDEDIAIYAQENCDLGFLPMDVRERVVLSSSNPSTKDYAYVIKRNCLFGKVYNTYYVNDKKVKESQFLIKVCALGVKVEGEFEPATYVKFNKSFTEVLTANKMKLVYWYTVGDITVEGEDLPIEKLKAIHTELQSSVSTKDFDEFMAHINTKQVTLDIKPLVVTFTQSKNTLLSMLWVTKEDGTVRVSNYGKNMPGHNGEVEFVSIDEHKWYEVGHLFPPLWKPKPKASPEPLVVDEVTLVGKGTDKIKRVLCLIRAFTGIVGVGLSFHQLLQKRKPSHGKESKSWDQIVQDEYGDELPSYQMPQQQNGRYEWVYDMVEKKWKRLFVYEGFKLEGGFKEKPKKPPPPDYTYKLIKINNDTEETTEVPLVATGFVDKVADVVKILKDAVVDNKEASIDPSVEALIPIVMKSYVKVTNGPMTLNGMKVKDRFVVCPSHVGKDPKVNGMESKTVTTWEAADQQLLYVKKMAPSKDITKLMPKMKDRDSFENKPGFILKKVGDVAVKDNINIQTIVRYHCNDGKEHIGVAYTSSSAVKYNNGATAPGDCGFAILVYNAKTDEKITAQHNASSGSVGKASNLYGDRINEAISEYLKSNRKEGYVNKPEVPIKPAPESIMGFKVIGESVIPGKEPPRTTRIYKSPLQTEGHIFDGEPAIMHPLDPRCENKEDLLPRLMKDYQLASGEFSPELNAMIDETAVEIGEYISGKIASAGLAPPRRLTLSELLNGDYHPNGSPINRDSSPGFPWYHIHPKKGDFMEQRNGRWCMNAEGQKIIENKMLMSEVFKTGNVPYVVYACTIKDEALKMAKIWEARSRTIEYSPFEYVLEYQEHHGMLYAYFQELRHELPFNTGINPTSYEWEMVYDTLRNMSPVGFDADFRRWDKTLKNRLGKGAIVVKRTIYKRLGAMQEPQEIIRREACELASVTPIILLKIGDNWYIIELPGGNVSGRPDTVQFNDLVHFILTVCVFKITFTLIPKVITPTFTTFIMVVVLQTYGDDEMQSVREDIIKYYNFKTSKIVIEGMFGMVCTPAVKDGVEVAYKPISELTFLQREFVEVEGRIVGPLLQKSLDKMLTYTRKSKTHRFNRDEPISFDVDTIVMTCQSALREATLRGPEYYDEIYTLCFNRCVEHGIPPPVYESWRMKFHTTLF